MPKEDVDGGGVDILANAGLADNAAALLLSPGKGDGSSAANSSHVLPPRGRRAGLTPRLGVGLLSKLMGGGGRHPHQAGAPGRGNEHTAGLKSTPRAEALVRTRIEPKTFFAAERTYLQWMHIAVLIMLTGLGLLTGSSIVVGVSQKECMTDSLCAASKISGAIITPVSVVFMVYALLMYKKRTIQILRRETVRYDDQRGPIVLTLLLIAVTIVSFVLALQTLRKGMPMA